MNNKIDLLYYIFGIAVSVLTMLESYILMQVMDGHDQLQFVFFRGLCFFNVIAPSSLTYRHAIGGFTAHNRFVIRRNSNRPLNKTLC